jgi:hypothetical protein
MTFIRFNIIFLTLISAYLTFMTFFCEATRMIPIIHTDDVK